jgi:hypothetical protein
MTWVWAGANKRATKDIAIECGMHTILCCQCSTRCRASAYIDRQDTEHMVTKYQTNYACHQPHNDVVHRCSVTGAGPMLTGTGSLPPSALADAFCVAYAVMPTLAPHLSSPPIAPPPTPLVADALYMQPVPIHMYMCLAITVLTDLFLRKNSQSRSRSQK